MPEPSADLIALAPHATLDDVSFVELTSRRNVDAVATNGAGSEPQYGLQAAIADDLHRFRLILRIDIEAPQGEIGVAVMANYTVDHAAPSLTMRLVIEYANELGVMTLLPFLRQAIADLTQRVFGGTLLMPILPRGAVQFELPD
jgi:hypothetical protein